MKRMLALGLAAVAGVSTNAAAGPECCEKAAARIKATLESADKAIARLKEFPQAAATMAEADKAAIAGARETLSKTCPICKAMPEAMGFIGESLAVSAGARGKACEGNACDGDAAASAAALTRAQLAGKSKALFGAMCAAMKPGAGQGDEAYETVCEKERAAAAAKGEPEKGCPAARTDALLKRADEVTARWQEAAGKFGALPEAERTALMAAMGAMKKDPTFAAWPEAIRALRGLLDATVAQDAACEKLCAAKEGEAKDAAACAPYMKRAALTKKVRDLVAQMAAVTGKDPCCEKEKQVVTQ